METLRPIAQALKNTGTTPSELFTHVDMTGSGRLNRVKFKAAFNPIRRLVRPPLSETDLDQLFIIMDRNKNCDVSRREFCQKLNNELKKVEGLDSREGVRRAGSRSGGSDLRGSSGSQQRFKETPFPMLRAADLEKPVLHSAGSEEDGYGRLPMRDGRYDWIRKANDHTDRQLRSQAALQTWAACQHESYELDGITTRLQRVKAMVDGTRLLQVDDFKDLLVPAYNLQTVWSRCPAGMSMPVAIMKAREGHKVAVVNAASAYHAGGGFSSGGRHALEESMCMQSTLAPSLFAAAEMARAKQLAAPSCASPPQPKGCSAWEVHIPNDGVVFSPHVEVFREGTFEGYGFSKEPVTLAAIISVAMPNANNKIRDAPVDMPSKHEEYLSLIHCKLYCLAASCVEAGVTHLIMVDAGCGVYGNDPTDVGNVFGAVIHKHFPTAFAEIVLSGCKSFADAAESLARIGMESSQPLNTRAGRKLYNIFKRFDLDADGVISRHELTIVMQRLDKDYWIEMRTEALVDSMDMDGDGRIRYETFSEWILSSTGPPDELKNMFLESIGMG